MSVVRRRGGTDDGRLRPKSFHYEANEGGLTKSLSEMHSIFNPKGQEGKEQAINGEKGSTSPPEALTDPCTPIEVRKTTFKSRFLRSKTDGNIFDKKPPKTDSGKPFKSRFLRKNTVEKSPVEDRKTFRSKYLNKKYGEQLKRIEQYASARNLDRTDNDDTSYSWKTYLENKAYRSQLVHQDISTEYGKTTLSPRSERRYNFARKIYKSTEETESSISSPKGRKKTDAGSSFDGSRRIDSYSPSSYLASRQRSERGDSGGGSRQSKYTGYSDKLSPGREYGTTGSDYYDGVKSSENSYSNGLYSKSRRSAIADLANDFRSQKTDTLRSPTSPSSQSDDTPGRISPLGERSSRRPSTIIRRPRNEFSPRDRSWSRDTDTYSRSSQLYSDINYHIDSERSTIGKHTSGLTKENRTRPRSMYLYSSETGDDNASDKENGRPGSVRPASVLLGVGVSTPDLSKSDEGEQNKEKQEKRRKEMEEARRQWRKERAETVDVELEEPTVVNKRSLLDSDVVLRKPRPLYPTDDGQVEALVMETELKSDKKTDKASRKDSGSKGLSTEGQATSKSKERRESTAQENQSINDQISGIKEKESSSTGSLSQEVATEQKRKNTNDGDVVTDKVDSGEREEETIDEKAGVNKTDPVRKKSSSVIRRKLDTAEAKKARARVNSMYGSLLDIDANDDEKGEERTEKVRNSEHDSARKARARPSSMYFDGSATVKDDSETETATKSRSGHDRQIPLIVHRGASESTDEEQLSPLQRAFSVDATLPRKSIQETSTSTVKPSLKDSSTQTTDEIPAPQKVPRARPRSLFFPPDDDDKPEVTMMQRNLRGDKVFPDEKTSTLDSRQHDTGQDTQSYRSLGGKDDSYRSLSSFYAWRMERLRTRKTKTKSGRRIFCGDSDSSDEGVPKYVPIRTIDISGVLSDDEESKSTKLHESKFENYVANAKSEKSEPLKTDTVKAEPARTEPVKTEPVRTRRPKAEPVKAEPVKPEPVKPEPVKPEPVKPESVKAEPMKTKPMKSELAKADCVKAETIKTETVKSEPSKVEPAKVEEVESLKSESNKSKSPITSTAIDKPRTEYRSEYLRRRRRKDSDVDVPKYVPIRTIDVSDLLASSDEEEKKKKAKVKAKEEEELAIIEKRRALRKSRSKLDLDKLSSDEDKGRSPKHTEERLRVDNSVVLRSKKKSETTLRPKSLNPATLYSRINDEYKVDNVQAVSDSFNSDLNNFRKEINRLLHKTDDYRDRPTKSKPTVDKNPKEVQPKVCDIRGDQVNVNHVLKDVDERLMMNELFEYPSTEDEWRRFVDNGVLIRKSVERIERQRYQSYQPFYYSDSGSSDESVGDLYELAQGISYARARRSFNSSYIGSEIASRKISSREASRDRQYGRYNRLGADLNDNVDRYMPYSPETAL